MVSQKVKGLLQKHIYCKYTDTKLMLLFNIIPVDSNAPVPTCHKFFIPAKFFLSFYPILHRAKNFLIG